MRFNDGTADPKSHAGPLRLGGKERIKDLIGLLRREPHAGIADRDHQLAVFGLLRLDGEFARPIYIFHRIDAISHEVHQHLLQLHAISHDLRKICQFRPD